MFRYLKKLIYSKFYFHCPAYQPIPLRQFAYQNLLLVLCYVVFTLNFNTVKTQVLPTS